MGREPQEAISLAALPEVFVSNVEISKTVFEAVERGELRKLGSRLYTRNLAEDPERLVRRNWYFLITSYFPDVLISDRTAFENRPAEDGSIFLVSKKKRDIEIPGVTFRPRKGPPPLETDRPFIGGAHLSSVPRAYTRSIDWTTMDSARRMLQESNAFADGNNARLKFVQDQ